MLKLKPGTYVYVGSAHGPGGVAARVGRHLRQNKRPHWHIDYVTAKLTPNNVIIMTGPEKQECRWVQALLRQPGTEVPLMGMGNGDCKAGCPAHFLRLESDEILRRTGVLP